MRESSEVRRTILKETERKSEVSSGCSIWFLRFLISVFLSFHFVFCCAFPFVFFSFTFLRSYSFPLLLFASCSLRLMLLCFLLFVLLPPRLLSPPLALLPLLLLLLLGRKRILTWKTVRTCSRNISGRWIQATHAKWEGSLWLSISSKFISRWEDRPKDRVKGRKEREEQKTQNAMRWSEGKEGDGRVSTGERDETRGGRSAVGDRNRDSIVMLCVPSFSSCSVLCSARSLFCRLLLPFHLCYCKKRE